jgi:hypothetical protein
MYVAQQLAEPEQLKHQNFPQHFQWLLVFDQSTNLVIGYRDKGHVERFDLLNQESLVPW